MVLPMNVDENMLVTEFAQEEEFVQEGEPLNQSSVNNHLSAEQLFVKSLWSTNQLHWNIVG